MNLYTPSQTLYNAFLEGFLFKGILYLKSFRTPYVKFFIYAFLQQIKNNEKSLFLIC